MEVDDTSGVPPPPPPAGDLPATFAASQSMPVQWKAFFRVALPPAVAIGFLTLAQPGLGCFLALPAGIALAIHLYRRRQPCLLNAGLGAKFGLVTGLLSFVFFSLLLTLAVAGSGTIFREAMEDFGHQLVARSYTPESQQLMQSLLNGPHWLTVTTSIFLGSTCIMTLLISTIAGALIGRLSRHRQLP